MLSVRLEAGYEPDGWLGPLCQDQPSFDFSSDETFDDEWNKLYFKLFDLMATGSQTCPSLDRITLVQPAA